MNMSEAIDSRVINGFTVEISPNIDTEDPRNEDNAGIMACFHKRYNLGDKKDKHGLRHEDFSGWDAMEAHIYDELDAAVVLPLYLYDHSGITIATTPFSCPWDSGQVGFIYMTKKAARYNFGIKYVTKKILAKVTALLKGEVTTYDDYLKGDVYCVTVKDANGDVVDCCGGYYIDHDVPYAERFDYMYADAAVPTEKAEREVVNENAV
jgi:hypothetical protein